MPALSISTANAAELPASSRGVSLRIVDVGIWALIGGAAYALKRFYAGAAPEDLRWVLAPTAKLVGFTSGTQFWFERHVGYVSLEAATAIVPACAGLNYLIMAFALLGTAFSARWRSTPSKLLWIAICALVATLSTVLVNTARIRFGMALRAVSLPLDGPQLHRVEGVIVYFGSLVLLYATVDALFAKAGRP